MTGDGQSEDGRGIAVAAVASLHTLDVRLAALKRLLDRKGADGALVQADRALIEVAIEAARNDLSGVRDLLASAPDDPASPYRAAAKVMIEAVAELDKLLDVLKGSIPPNG